MRKEGWGEGEKGGGNRGTGKMEQRRKRMVKKEKKDGRRLDGLVKRMEKRESGKVKMDEGKTD